MHRPLYGACLCVQIGHGLDQSFPNANPQAVDLMKSLLQFNPVNRPSAMEALDHPWFNNIRERATEVVATGASALINGIDLDGNGNRRCV